MVSAANYNNAKQIRRTVVNLILSFYYHRRQDILSGLIRSEVKYRARFVHALDHLETSDKDDYATNVPSKPDIVKCNRHEDVFEDKRSRSLLVSTTDRSALLFVVYVVKETWVGKLEDANTYFNCVSTKALIHHLLDNCGGLDYTGAVNIHLAMTLWWGEYHGVLEFILQMEKDQKKSVRANIPVKDAYMATITTCSIRVNQAFPAECEV